MKWVFSQFSPWSYCESPWKVRFIGFRRRRILWRYPFLVIIPASRISLQNASIVSIRLPHNLDKYWSVFDENCAVWKLRSRAFKRYNFHQKRIYIKKVTNQGSLGVEKCIRHPRYISRSWECRLSSCIFYFENLYIFFFTTNFFTGFYLIEKSNIYFKRDTC